MLISALLFFSIAALLGMYLLSFILSNKETPKAIAFTHGGIAATGLVLLIIYAFFYTPAPIVSIVFFIFAALGGLMLIYRDLMGNSVPKWMALAHGITALIAFTLLLVFMFDHMA